MKKEAQRSEIEVIQVKDLFANMILEQNLKPEGNLVKLRKDIVTRSLGYAQKNEGFGKQKLYRT